jgi:hypothetical protein
VGRGVAVGVLAGVFVGVALGETVAVTVAVAVAVGVGVAVAVAVGVPEKWHQTTLAVSTRQPSLDPVLSLAMRQRSTPLISSPGRVTTVVMKPPELPLQA